jgi:hypothetical protein
MHMLILTDEWFVNGKVPMIEMAPLLALPACIGLRPMVQHKKKTVALQSIV